MQDDEVIEHQDEQVEGEQEVTADNVLSDMDVGEDNTSTQDEPVEKQVPLSALQKERKKRQEAELQNEWHVQQQQRLMQQQAPAQEAEVDESMYETATRGDVQKSRQETIKATVREVNEQIWIEQNPEKKAMIDDDLPKFLKQRPNQALAIDAASNRYKEAYELMDAFTGSQKKQMERSTKRAPAPGSPSSMPKSAVTNESVDVMKMSDKEFLEWRKSQSKRR